MTDGPPDPTEADQPAVSPEPVEPVEPVVSPEPVGSVEPDESPETDGSPEIDEDRIGDSDAERITEIGGPELLDTGDHTVAAIVGGVALVAVLLLALFGFSHVLEEAAERREVPVVVVPRLSNRPVAQAQAQLERLGLIVDVQFQPNERVPADVVVAQSPIAGARLEVGARVVLSVSDGPSGVRVPDVVGQPVADATRLMSVIGLTAVPIEEYDESVPAGEVIATNPPASNRSLVGAPVELIVSKGPEPRVVPEVVGLPSADGMVLIGAAELNVGTVTRRAVDGVEPGKIASVDPPVGTSVPRDSRVNVVISIIPPVRTVPDLVGMRRATAVKIADELGITLTVRTEAVTAGDRRAGLVISQTPVADSPVAAMTVTVAAVPTPSTTTTTRVPGSTTTTTRPRG